MPSDPWLHEQVAAPVGVGHERRLLYQDAVGLLVHLGPLVLVRVAPGFVDLLMARPAERVVLEITEHAHVADYDQILATLAPLRARGVRLAVDDAGAGYSSLQHILQLQPDIIKIDRELIDHVDQDKYKQAIVSKLIDLAKQLQIDVVAEGIERQGELDFLTDHGVDYVQGYLLGRPEALPFVASA